MIGFLKGSVQDFIGEDVLILVNGVGYRVTVSEKSRIVAMPEAELFIHTYVKEDQLALYGFLSRKQLKLFVLLISVSGVGPKMAMNILSTGSAEEIQRAVATADVSFFTKVKGIGKKNGQRVIVDLKSKLGDVQALEFEDESSSGNELVQALVGMGFEQRKATQVVESLDQTLPESEQLKLAIKQLSLR